jgi:hypothetical protein
MVIRLLQAITATSLHRRVSSTQKASTDSDVFCSSIFEFMHIAYDSD